MDIKSSYDIELESAYKKLDGYIDDLQKYSESTAKIQNQIQNIESGFKPLKVTPLSIIGMIFLVFMAVSGFFIDNIPASMVLIISLAVIIYLSIPRTAACERETKPLYILLEREMKRLENSIESVKQTEEEIEKIRQAALSKRSDQK